MKKIGLFYGGTTAKTAVVALKIQEAFAENEVVLIPIEGATRKEFESFDNIIAGTSTWFDGELPTYWDEFMPEIESIDMTGKKVALFGLCRSKILLTNRYNLGTDFTENTEKINSSV